MLANLLIWLGPTPYLVQNSDHLRNVVGLEHCGYSLCMESRGRRFFRHRGGHDPVLGEVF